MTKDEADMIEKETRDQSSTAKWFDERQWRLTASRFGDIVHASDRRNMTELSASMYSPPSLHTEAIVHGQVHEKSAITKFEEVTGKRVSPCGFYIDLEQPFLGASPDGLVKDEDALVEVKCSYKGREKNVDATTDFPFLEKGLDGVVRLKKSHKYYAQVMGQMGVCKKKMSYFVVHTFCDLFIQEIPFDKNYFDTMIPKLLEFYNQHYVPFVSSKL